MQIVRYLLSVALVVTATLGATLAIILTGVVIIKANPVRWLTSQVWRCGVVLVGLFLLMGIYWG